jgi:hypothetical protein
MRTALGLYMQDRHLDNESEVLRSALGQFLEREGYLPTSVQETHQKTSSVASAQRNRVTYSKRNRKHRQ